MAQKAGSTPASARPRGQLRSRGPGPYWTVLGPRLTALAEGKGGGGRGNAPGCAAWGCETCAITSELDLLLCFYLFIFLKQKTKAKNQQRTNKQTKHYHGTCFCLWASPKVGRYFCFFSKGQQVRQFFILRTFSPPPPKGLIIYPPCKLCENPKY